MFGVFPEHDVTHPTNSYRRYGNHGLCRLAATMQLKRKISVLLPILAFIQAISGQYVEPLLCRGLCFCSNADSAVDCSPRDHIRGLPTNLPSGTTTLKIQGAMFPAPGRLIRQNFTGLGHLIRLSIVNSQLRSIEPRTFLGMTNLRFLDLSLNQLHHLEAYTFYGLKLTQLYLQKQDSLAGKTDNVAYRYEAIGTNFDGEGLQLEEEVFHSMSATQINLQQNRISEIPFRLFSKVNGLEKLILSSNNIRSLDSKFADYFDRPDRLIDLTDNPLICSCSLAWLAARSKEWVAKLSSLNITCLVDDKVDILPGRFGRPLSDRKIRVELRKLSSGQLCMSSRIRSIGVEIDPSGERARLSCTAVAYNSLDTSNTSPNDLLYLPSDDGVFRKQSVVPIRAPSVAWKYIELGQMRQVSWMRSDQPPPPDPLEQHNSLGSQDRSATTVQLNVSLSPQDQQFNCITWDEKENDEEVLVTIRGPGSVLPQTVPADEVTLKDGKTVAEVLSKSSGEHIKEAQERDDVVLVHKSALLFRKQYTLLEMIGAIVGTFLSTLILLLIGSKCFHCFRTRGYGLPPHGHALSITSTKDLPVLGRPNEAETSKSLEPNNSSTANGNKNTVNNGTSDNATTCVASTPQSANYDSTTATMSNLYPSFSPYIAQTGVTTFPQFLPTASLLASPTYHQHLPTSMPVNVTTPLLQTNPMHSNLMVPGMSTCSQPVAYWQAPPGSTYSAAGSHEYDIPRGMDASQTTCDQQSTAPQAEFAVFSNTFDDPAAANS
ncbi:hypothetical protein SprV_0200881900 [Sparganum proliferum]